MNNPVIYLLIFLFFHEFKPYVYVFVERCVSDCEYTCENVNTNKQVKTTLEQQLEIKLSQRDPN